MKKIFIIAILALLLLSTGCSKQDSQSITKGKVELEIVDTPEEAIDSIEEDLTEKELDELYGYDEIPIEELEATEEVEPFVENCVVNEVCEAEYGETAENCPEDCTE